MNSIEALKEYLLNHEHDIYYYEDDFADLLPVFIEVIGREPEGRKGVKIVRSNGVSV